MLLIQITNNRHLLLADSFVYKRYALLLERVDLLKALDVMRERLYNERRIYKILYKGGMWDGE